MNTASTFAEIPVVPQRHLVVLRNPKATNGDSRQGEIDELIKLDCWSTSGVVGTLPENDQTIDALAAKLEEVDQLGESDAEVVVVSVGGDFTHDAAMQGIGRAKLTRLRAILAAAKAGNKDDTPSNLGTDYHHLCDIVQLGKPTEIYPLEATVTVGDKTPRTYRTIHSLGAIASEIVAGGVNEAGFPKGSFISEGLLAIRSIFKARKNPLKVEASNIGLRPGKYITDLIFAADKAIAGGAVRFKGSSWTNPNRIVLAHSGRSWLSILGGIAARLRGNGPGYTQVEGGDVSVTIKGLERIQVGGEVVQIQEDPGRERSVTLSVGRAEPITALTMDRPANLVPKHRKSAAQHRRTQSHKH